PGVTGTQTAVTFLGGGSPVVVIGANSDVNRTVSVKHITIEIADYVGGGNDVLGDETPTKEGYTFVRADGSDWNILEVTNDLSVLSGALHADVGVNIYSKGRTEVLDGAELHISQQAFVRAMKGIDVSGTVTIDAYDRSTPGVASSRNDGKLYVVNGGSINIIQTQDAGTGTPNVYVGNVKVNGVLGAFSFDDENDLPITDYSYDQLSYDADGSNISNDGILTNEHGSVIAEGNLTNSGTLTQTYRMGGEGTPTTWVYGTLTNTGKGSVTEGDTQRNLGVFIENGEVLVGALDNQGDFTLSGFSNLGVTGFVTLTPDGAPTEVEGTETLEDGSTIKKTTTTTNYDVTTQAAQVTNSGNLSITGESSMLVYANQDYTVTHEVVEYEDGRIDITTTRKPLAKPEVHNGKLTNSGTITINSEPWSDRALEVQGELENTEGGTLALQKGNLLVTSALINEGEVAISGGSAESAYVDNFGELKVSGGSLIVYDLLLSTDKREVSGGGTMVAADKMINEGGLTIAGGATMYVGNGSAVSLPTAEGIIVLDDFLENSGTIT
ncbi:MAG: hypothetical protein IJY72_01345, partial [Akkermansia sp.]|nr:hypothetical protein [Akkermansia sp.]